MNQIDANRLQFFENASVALHLVGPDGTILDANQAELDLLGYSREEYVGRKITEFHVDADVIADILRRSAAGERLSNYPARLRAKDGTLRHVLIDSRARFAGDTFVHTRCFTRDITSAADARHEAEAAHRRLAFLASATTSFAASLDYHETVQRVARLLVPDFGDWAAVHVIRGDGVIDLVALAHTDADRETVVREWLGRRPLSPRARYGVPVVIRTGTPLFRPQVGPEMLERAARTPDELERLQALGITSAIIVPLSTRGRTFGTITVMTAASGRRYTIQDVSFMEDVGRRAALAIDNARLYQQAEAARMEAEAVGEARQRLAAIVDGSDDVIVSKSLDGVIASWNPAAEKVFGWTASEAIGRHITLIIPPDRHDEEAEVLRRVRRGESVEHFETVRITKYGQYVNISLTVSPVRDSSGRIIGASKIARDITDRLRAEESRARLAAIVDSSDDAIVGKTLDGIITSWNRAAEKMFGWTAAEAVGRHIMLIVPADRRAEEDHVLATLRRGDRVDHFDTVRVAKDGRLLDVSLSVSPIADAAGRIVGASTIARDITERRRMEAELTRLLALEQAARAQAQSASRAKDELLATVSHELRTPMSAVLGWARMLQSADLDEATRARALEVIVRSSAAQLRLIDDLLDVSRIVTGNMRLELQPLNIRTVIEAALDAIRPAARSKSIDLAVDLGAAPVMVVGAADRLQQVVWNIVMNAVKFTPRLGRIDVRLRERGDEIEMSVTDSGEGIASEALPHIFDRFRQEDSSTTRKHTGLGLGLALVRHIVELHGGVVSAESPGKGQGATFTVRLPRAEVSGSR
jgi:PAS domain S-box-containing protein